jgi:hypothetical protein
MRSCGTYKDRQYNGRKEKVKINYILNCNKNNKRGNKLGSPEG